MADDEVATKAPESDAVSASLLPGDSVAQHGASMGVRPPNPSQELGLKIYRIIA
jgi:hypothetical protein